MNRQEYAEQRHLNRARRRGHQRGLEEGNGILLWGSVSFCLVLVGLLFWAALG